MTLEDQLQRFYRDIDVDVDAERRVRAAVLDTEPAQSRRVVLVAVAAVVVVATAVLIAVLRPESRPAPATHSAVTPSSPATVGVVIPASAPNTITGAVLDRGKPVARASVEVEVWPNGTIQERLHRGDPVPTLSLAPVLTTAHGGFRVTVSAKSKTAKFREGDFVNIDVNLYVTHGKVNATWSLSLHLRHGQARAVRIVFDVGRKTVTVGRTTQPLPVY